MHTKCFDKIPRRTIYVWECYFAGYGVDALGLYKEMSSIGVPCDRFIHTYVLKACVASKLVTVLLKKRLVAIQGLLILEKGCLIQWLSNIRFILVDLLDRANGLHERIEPGPKVWGSLLGSCRIQCDMELAERASNPLFELEPSQCWKLYLVADIYAKAGSWDEVKRVKQQGLD